MKAAVGKKGALSQRKELHRHLEAWFCQGQQQGAKYVKVSVTEGVYQKQSYTRTLPIG